MAFTIFLVIALLFLFVNKIFSVTNVNSRYYPRYHLAPPYGWMNDPNGFSIFRDEYHLFYQYNPKSSQEPGIAHWGHAKSFDLFHWEHLPIAMYPDEWYDVDGVFSGSAIVENDTMYLIYTGNINHPGENPDHEQHQNLAYGTDGINFTKVSNNPIINGKDKQPDFRDPKIWKHGNTFYTVLGNEQDDKGRALLYTSKDLMSWDETPVIDSSNGSLGFMWECPDFFELDGKFVLLFSPQGMEPQGDKYRNLYQTGYIIGKFDYNTNKFTPETEFQELDHGHDFYATQTLEATDGRRILIAWMDMWEEVYPERDDGWTGQMTLPRELKILNGKLLQVPIKETNRARGRALYKGESKSAKNIQLENNSAEIFIEAPSKIDLSVRITSGSHSNDITINYDHAKGSITLDRGGNDGIRRTEWKPSGDIQWRIFVDASSLELFCGDGEVTFSSRFFPNGQLSLNISGSADMEVFSMLLTVPSPGFF